MKWFYEKLLGDDGVLIFPSFTSTALYSPKIMYDIGNNASLSDSKFFPYFRIICSIKYGVYIFYFARTLNNIFIRSEDNS